MKTDRPSGTPPSTQVKSAPPTELKTDTAPPGRSSDLDLVRQTLPAMAPAISQRPGHLRLASGRSITVVELGGGDERVDVRSPGGEVLVSVRLTDDGPVFAVSGISLEVTAAKSLTLSAESVRVAASKHLALEAGEVHRVRAQDVEIEATPGAVSIRAEDDVDIAGAQVRLSPEVEPDTSGEFRARGAHGHPFSNDMPLSPLRPAPPGSRDPLSLEPSVSAPSSRRADRR